MPELRRTFLVIDEDHKQLVYQEVTNEKGMLISKEELATPEKSKTTYKYNNNDLMILEVEFSDGLECSRSEHVYDSENRLVNSKTFIAGELFEELIFQFEENVFVSKTIQNGEEIEKEVQTWNGDSYLIKSFENLRLTGTISGKYDRKLKKDEMKSLDENNQVISVTTSHYNESDLLSKYENRNGEGELLYKEENTYKSGLLSTKKTIENRLGESRIREEIYDGRENLIGMEERHLDGTLIDWLELNYDHKGRVLREKGCSNSFGFLQYGIELHLKEYEFFHEYEQIQ